MGIALKELDEGRWTRDLRDPNTLADDLGTAGCFVGPRVGPFPRTQGQKEDYVIRRLLVACKRADGLSWPLRIRAEKETDHEPDFLLIWPDGHSLGVEVVEAGEEAYQAWLTGTEEIREAGGPNVVHVPFDASTDRTVDELCRAIDSKVSKFDSGAYRRPDACDLVVYDNTSWGGFLDKSSLIEAVRGRSGSFTGRFRQVHIVFGRAVWLDALGNRAEPVDVSGAYEIDFAKWLFEQAEVLRGGALEKVDRNNIAEELEDLGRSERRALASHLRNLILHLLNWEHQSSERSTSWANSIDNARSETYELLTESPSLRADLRRLVDQSYARARKLASRETDLGLEEFPEICPYKLEQLLDPEFYPDGGGRDD